MRTVVNRSRLRAAVICVAVAAPLLAARKPITLDVIMDQPHGAHGGGTAIWAPDGTRFVHDDRGRVMLYDPAKKNDSELFKMEDLERAATPVPEAERFAWRNRRVDEQSIEWTGDGRALLVAVKGDLFLYRFADRKWEQLTHTVESEASPKISPDGRLVAFRRDTDLYVLDVGSKQVTRLTSNGSETLLNGQLDWVYPEELDLGTAMWWSPDSQRLAYMQFDISKQFIYPQVVLTGPRAIYEPERYPQAGTPNAMVRIGVIAMNDSGHATRWIDTGSDPNALL